MDIDIETLRAELNNEIVMQNWDLTHPAVIRISNLLDELIVDVIKTCINATAT